MLSGPEIDRARAQIDAETEFDSALLDKESSLDEQQAELQHRQQIMRVRQESELRVERECAAGVAGQRVRIDAEFAERREAVLRERAEAEHAAWEEAQRAEWDEADRTGTVSFAHFGGDSGRSAREPRTWWRAARRSRR